MGKYISKPMHLLSSVPDQLLPTLREYLLKLESSKFFKVERKEKSLFLTEKSRNLLLAGSALGGKAALEKGERELQMAFRF